LVVTVKKLSVDWEGLHTFTVFYEQGSYAAAARALSLTHATVSRRLRQLEEQFGAPLFVRRGDATELTETGSAVLETARTMYEQAGALERRIAGADSRIEGPVRIACTESLGAQFLAPRLPQLLEQWPGLNVELVTGHLAVSLARRDADLALRFARPEAGDLIARQIGQIAYYLCGTPTCIANMRAGKASFITYDDGVPEIPETRWCERNVPRHAVRLRSNSLVVQSNAAQAGAGLALLPDYLIGPSLQHVHEEAALYRDIWLIYHHDLKHVPRLRTAMRWLEHCFEA
jgi:DNA-binding transcriptional LysR family regulator